MADLPKHTEAAWSQVRAMFERYAPLYSAATKYELASAIADKAARDIEDLFSIPADADKLRMAAMNAAAALEVMGLSEAVSVTGCRDLKTEALTVANRLRQALSMPDAKEGD